jgi:hypothetical protein
MLLQSQILNSSLDLSRMFSRFIFVTLKTLWYTNLQAIQYKLLFCLASTHVPILTHMYIVCPRSIELFQLLHTFADASICLVNLVVKCEELHLWKSLLILPHRIRHTFTYAIIFSCAYIHKWLLKTTNFAIFLSYEDNISVWIQEPCSFFLSFLF